MTTYPAKYKAQAELERRRRQREREEQSKYDWPNIARPNQLSPAGTWRSWLVLAGRGFGKTRTGAEWVRAQVEMGSCKRLALVAATSADARDVMVEGESGLLAIAPPWDRPLYEPSKRRLTWPNGAIATTYSADEPDRLRGPQHDGAWCDELASWRFAEAFDMLMLGLRLGSDPRCVVTTTPKAVPILRDLLKQPTTVKTGGSTYENKDNLAPAFMEQIIARYEGTRLGRQELNAELLEDVEGALWSRALLDTGRVTQSPTLERIIVGVDPSTTAGGDEAGIVVAGTDALKKGYVIDDRTVQGSPDVWARTAVTAYHTHHADLIVAESNQGGEMVSQVIKSVDPLVPVKLVHASKGKVARAEPVHALYEQGKVHHVGYYPLLEDELCSWVVGNQSPNRLDALVWALTELMIDGNEINVWWID